MQNNNYRDEDNGTSKRRNSLNMFLEQNPNFQGISYIDIWCLLAHQFYISQQRTQIPYKDLERFAKNKDEVNSETTHMQNKNYHINGYRIKKIKCILMQKLEISTKEKQDNTSEIENLKNEKENLREAMNQLITFVKEMLSKT